MKRLLLKLLIVLIRKVVLSNLIEDTARNMMPSMNHKGHSH